MNNNLKSILSLTLTALICSLLIFLANLLTGGNI